MPQISVEDGALSRARRIGSETAMIVAAVTGLVGAILARDSGGLVASIAASTVVVTGFARAAGRLAGQHILPRSWLLAAGIGALGGLSSLLVAALSAGVCGAVWGLRGSSTGVDYWWSFIGKPMVAVLGGGAIWALLIGVITGLIIRGRIGASSATQH